MLLAAMDIPEILEDEDIVGWLCAIASENGWDRNSFMSAFFPENIICKSSISVVIDYIHIYKKYRALGFPEPNDMLMAHTDVPVSGLFTPAFYTGMLADMMLNGTDTFPFEKTQLHRPFMYCPLCAKEDIHKSGRIVVHIPHQVQGVTACYKHGVKLSGNAGVEAEKADRQEVRVAQVIQTLYKAHAVGSIEDIMNPLRDRIIECGMNLPGKSKRFPVNTAILGLAASLFTDSELLQIFAKDDEWIVLSADIIRKDSPGVNHFTRDFPFISYTCGKCGTKVTQFAITAFTGGMCPACSRHTQWQAKTTRRARHSIDPLFRIVRFRGDKKADIRHIPCGRVLEGRMIEYIFRAERMNCPFCRKDSHESHLGESRRMNCGLKAVITRFDSVIDVDVIFEDGSERTGIQYKNFLLGNVIPKGFIQRSHIGEKKIMNCGIECEIIRYDSQFDMDVRFSDGSMRCHVYYGTFMAGRLQPEGFRLKKKSDEIVGMWQMMNCGLKAKIIEYRYSIDCDVEFEDGSIRKSVRLDHFKRGELSPEGFYLPKVGEERVMRNGLVARIIAVRSSKDIDVQFLENGEICTGVYYTAYCDGFVKSELLETRRKDSHIGERYLQNCGIWAEIIKYENANKVTVRYDNGELREDARYDKLKRGSVLPPSLQKKSRVGERYLQNCGLLAEIIADHSSTDIDVRFENGRIRKHVTLVNLKKGVVQPLNRAEKFREDHMGEERIMNCGIKAKIIDINNALDITVQFETGEIRDHVTYANFKSGAISPIKRERTR